MTAREIVTECKRRMKLGSYRPSLNAEYNELIAWIEREFGGAGAEGSGVGSEAP